MHEAAVTEFPFVEAMPKREKSKLAKLWEHFQELKAIAAEKGVIIPQNYAADLLGVSRQRVHQLVNDGRLEAVEVRGIRFVTEASVMEWAKAERDKGGRPATVPGIRETFRLARVSAQEMAHKKTSETS